MDGRERRVAGVISWPEVFNFFRMGRFSFQSVVNFFFFFFFFFLALAIGLGVTSVK